MDIYLDTANAVDVRHAAEIGFWWCDYHSELDRQGRKRLFGGAQGNMLHRRWAGECSKILVASMRHPIHVKEAAMMGADIATIPFKVWEQLFSHPLTDSEFQKFLEGWTKVPKKQ